MELISLEFIRWTHDRLVYNGPVLTCPDVSAIPVTSWVLSLGNNTSSSAYIAPRPHQPPLFESNSIRILNDAADFTTCDLVDTSAIKHLRSELSGLLSHVPCSRETQQLDVKLDISGTNKSFVDKESHLPSFETDSLERLSVICPVSSNGSPDDLFNTRVESLSDDVFETESDTNRRLGIYQSSANPKRIDSDSPYHRTLIDDRDVTTIQPDVVNSENLTSTDSVEISFSSGSYTTDLDFPVFEGEVERSEKFIISEGSVSFAFSFPFQTSDDRNSQKTNSDGLIRQGENIEDLCNRGHGHFNFKDKIEVLKDESVANSPGKIFLIDNKSISDSSNFQKQHGADIHDTHEHDNGPGTVLIQDHSEYSERDETDSVNLQSVVSDNKPLNKVNSAKTYTTVPREKTTTDTDINKMKNDDDESGADSDCVSEPFVDDDTCSENIPCTTSTILNKPLKTLLTVQTICNEQIDITTDRDPAPENVLQNHDSIDHKGFCQFKPNQTDPQETTYSITSTPDTGNNALDIPTQTTFADIDLLEVELFVHSILSYAIDCLVTELMPACPSSLLCLHENAPTGSNDAHANNSVYLDSNELVRATESSHENEVDRTTAMFIDYRDDVMRLCTLAPIPEVDPILEQYSLDSVYNHMTSSVPSPLRHNEYLPSIPEMEVSDQWVNRQNSIEYDRNIDKISSSGDEDRLDQFTDPKLSDNRKESESVSNQENVSLVGENGPMEEIAEHDLSKLSICRARINNTEYGNENVEASDPKPDDETPVPQNILFQHSDNVYKGSDREKQPEITAEMLEIRTTKHGKCPQDTPCDVSVKINNKTQNCLNMKSVSREIELDKPAQNYELSVSDFELLVSSEYPLVTTISTHSETETILENQSICNKVGLLSDVVNLDTQLKDADQPIVKTESCEVNHIINCSNDENKSDMEGNSVQELSRTDNTAIKTQDLVENEDIRDELLLHTSKVNQNEELPIREKQPSSKLHSNNNEHMHDASNEHTCEKMELNCVNPMNIPSHPLYTPIIKNDDKSLNTSDLKLDDTDIDDIDSSIAYPGILDERYADSEPIIFKRSLANIEDRLSEDVAMPPPINDIQKTNGNINISKNLRSSADQTQEQTRFTSDATSSKQTESDVLCFVNSSRQGSEDLFNNGPSYLSGDDEDRSKLEVGSTTLVTRNSNNTLKDVEHKDQLHKHNQIEENYSKQDMFTVKSRKDSFDNNEHSSKAQRLSKVLKSNLSSDLIKRPEYRIHSRYQSNSFNLQDHHRLQARRHQSLSERKAKSFDLDYSNLYHLTEGTNVVGRLSSGGSFEDDREEKRYNHQRTQRQEKAIEDGTLDRMFDQFRKHHKRKDLDSIPGYQSSGKADKNFNTNFKAREYIPDSVPESLAYVQYTHAPSTDVYHGKQTEVVDKDISSEALSCRSTGQNNKTPVYKNEVVYREHINKGRENPISAQHHINIVPRKDCRESVHDRTDKPFSEGHRHMNDTKSVLQHEKDFEQDVYERRDKPITVGNSDVNDETTLHGNEKAYSNTLQEGRYKPEKAYSNTLQEGRYKPEKAYSNTLQEGRYKPVKVIKDQTSDTSTSRQMQSNCNNTHKAPRLFQSDRVTQKRTAFKDRTFQVKRLEGIEQFDTLPCRRYLHTATSVDTPNAEIEDYINAIPLVDETYEDYSGKYHEEIGQFMEFNPSNKDRDIYKEIKSHSSVDDNVLRKAKYSHNRTGNLTTSVSFENVDRETTTIRRNANHQRHYSRNLKDGHQRQEPPHKTNVYENIGLTSNRVISDQFSIGRVGVAIRDRSLIDSSSSTSRSTGFNHNNGSAPRNKTLHTHPTRLVKQSTHTGLTNRYGNNTTISVVSGDKKRRAVGMRIQDTSEKRQKDGPLSLNDAYGPMEASDNQTGPALSNATNHLSESMTSLSNRHAPAVSPSRQSTLTKQQSLQSSHSELNGDQRHEDGIKFERLKNLPEEELMVKIKEIIGHMERLDDYHRGDGMRIQKMLGDMYWDYAHIREMLGDSMAESGYAVVSMTMLKTLNGIGIFKNDDVWFPTYYTYNTMWNFTDASSKLAKTLSENDAVRLLTLNCGHKPYMNAIHSKNVYYVIKASLSILHNIARNSGMKHLFDENKTSETIMPFLESEDEMLKILATLTIANIVDEEENKTLIAESGTIHDIVNWIEKALSLPRRRYKGFTPQELTEGLNKLAVNDSNKMRIVDEGALRLFLQMLQHDDIREQSSAARIVWTLSFDKDVRQKINENADLVSVLEKLTDSTNKSLQTNCSGALWIIRGDNDVSTEKRPKTNKNKTHVFLSYAWADRELVLSIRDRLRAEGYAIWIDIEKMGNAELDTMTDAVENSAVVLLCMSEKYKQSPNCRTEAEYTFQLKKDYIPLMLQKKYRPDGWVGTILGAKLYFDFSGKYPFDKSFQGLLKELRGRGKVTPNTTPGDSNDHTDPAMVHSLSLSSHTSAGTPVHHMPLNSAILNMGQEELVKWLRNIKLTECIPAFMEFDGRLLTQLKVMRTEAPEFFYQCLEKRLNMSLIEILKFTRALEELQ